MKFRTEIEITSLGVKISYENRVLALGSCFAAHIARKLAGAKFRVAENPSGILSIRSPSPRRSAVMPTRRP